MTIKRFAEIFGVDDTVIKEHPHGLYVRYDDYAQEIEQLKAAQQHMYGAGKRFEALWRDAAQEIARLRNDLTACQLERDGMRKELERIRQERLTWAMVCDHACQACTDLDDVIRGHVPQSGEQT